MELLTLQEVALKHGDRLYRESSLIPLLVALASFGVAAGIVFMYSRGDAPLLVAIVPGGGLALFSLFFFHIFMARPYESSGEAPKSSLLPGSGKP